MLFMKVKKGEYMGYSARWGSAEENPVLIPIPPGNYFVNDHQYTDLHLFTRALEIKPGTFGKSSKHIYWVESGQRTKGEGK